MSPDQPNQPDFTQLAQQTANSNRYNIATPTGNTTWNVPGVPTATQTLAPVPQQILNQRQGIETSALSAASPLLSNPTINQSLLPKAPINAGMTAQSAVMSRLQPELERQRNALQNQLVNWGLRPGSELYDQQMAEQSRRENDLLTQAALQGINLDTAARQNAIAEQQAFLQTPVNTLNAFRTGQQMPSPGMGGGTDYLSAANKQYLSELDRYNAAVGNRQNWLQSIAGIIPMLG